MPRIAAVLPQVADSSQASSRDDFLGAPEILGSVHRHPEALVPKGGQLSFGRQLGKRRPLVVSSLRQALERLRAEEVDTAADPVRKSRSLLKARDEISAAELDDAEGRVEGRDCDRRGHLSVAVAAERLGLLHRDDVRADSAELGEKERALAGGAADEHPLHAGLGERRDLVGRERTPPDRDNGLRPSLSGRAEPLGLAARQDDGFHYAWSSGSGSDSSVSGSAPRSEEARPIDSYVKPAARTAPGSSRLRPSTMRGVRMASRISRVASSRSSSHSVTMTAASAPVTASSSVDRRSIPRMIARASSSATGSQPRTSAPSARRRGARMRLGASRRSFVFGLKARPRMAIVFPRRPPRCFLSFPMTRRFWSSFTSMTAVRSWKW